MSRTVQRHHGSAHKNGPNTCLSLGSQNTNTSVIWPGSADKIHVMSGMKKQPIDQLPVCPSPQQEICLRSYQICTTISISIHLCLQLGRAPRKWVFLSHYSIHTPCTYFLRFGLVLIVFCVVSPMIRLVSLYNWRATGILLRTNNKHKDLKKNSIGLLQGTV